nr:hypothetical protein [Tanacetum cinerariifolium]
MIAVLEKSEHNVNFHQIVDFVEASHIRYTLTINPTVYVSHIRQFWSTARIKTTNEGTKILATVDGKPRTISESSIRRNLKLNNEKGISSLPDAELFENLALMDNIATAVVCLATNRVYNFSKMIFDGMVRNVNNKGSKFLMYPRVNSPSFLGRTVPLLATMLVTQGEGLGIPIETHHTPSLEAQQLPPNDTSSPLHLNETTETIPTSTPTEIPLLRKYSRRATWIAQSKALSTAADEPASPLGDDSQGEAFPTQTKMVTKIAAQDLEISNLKARIQLLEDKDKGKMVNVLTSMDATNILTSRVQAVSVPPVGEIPTVGVPTGSGLVPTGSAIFTTTSVVTPYSRRKGKEKMVESDTPKKKKLQEQIDVQMAREMEEEMARDAQRMNEQIARDAKIAKIHAEEELQIMIDGLDRSNEMIAKHLNESHSGWKTKHFKGMTLEEIREKFIPVWKKIEDFVPMASKEEGERLVPVEEVYVEALQVKHPIIDWKIHTEGKRDYWKIIRLGGNTIVYQFFMDMLKQFNREDLNQLWTLVKETLSIKQASSDKEKELWVELKRLFEPDHEDQLWTHTQALMHDPLEWKLYDTCGVHNIFTRDQEIFMLVERDYLLRKGLAIVMISNKIQRVAPAEKVCTAEKLSINRGQRHIYISQRRMSVIPGMCPMIDPMIQERVTITLLFKVVDPYLRNNIYQYVDWHRRPTVGITYPLHEELAHKVSPSEVDHCCFEEEDPQKAVPDYDYYS